jgi:alpha-amylase
LSARALSAIAAALAIACAALAIACAALAIACTPEPRSAISTHVDDWRDRVIYQIVVDRFANGDRSNDAADGVDVVPGDLSRVQGGDWRGVIDHLDYVERLGASAIWISPVVSNVGRIESEDGYHGYWASDFTTHNPRFGSLEELEELVVRAHARGIAVIVDVVTNHTGRVFAYDLDADGVVDPGEDLPPFRESAYEVPLIWHVAPPLLFDVDGGLLELGSEHFRRRGIGDLGDYEQRRLGDFPTGLRDLDTEREDIVRAMIETTAQWVIRTDIDGLRIDAVPHVDIAFWERFCAGLRRRLHDVGKDRFFLLGEIFELDPREIARHTGPDALDAGFDFPLKHALIDRVILGGEPPALARGALEENRALFRTTPQPLGIGLDPWQARVAIADSHDLPRIRSLIDDPFAVDQAMVALFTIDAIPTVYYGTEQELAGGSHHGRREPLWETGYREDGPTFGLIARLAAIRDASIALRRGSLVLRLASAHGGNELDLPPPDAGLIAWERVSGDDRALIALATHPVISARAVVPTGFAPGTILEDRLGGALAVEVYLDGSVELELGPRASAIFAPRR